MKNFSYYFVWKVVFIKGVHGQPTRSGNWTGTTVGASFYSYLDLAVCTFKSSTISVYCAGGFGGCTLSGRGTSRLTLYVFGGSSGYTCGDVGLYGVQCQHGQVYNMGTNSNGLQFTRTL